LLVLINYSAHWYSKIQKKTKEVHLGSWLSLCNYCKALIQQHKHLSGKQHVDSWTWKGTCGEWLNRWADCYQYWLINEDISTDGSKAHIFPKERPEEQCMIR
jgi:hypothetical protein